MQFDSTAQILELQVLLVLRRYVLMHGDGGDGQN